MKIFRNAAIGLLAIYIALSSACVSNAAPRESGDSNSFTMLQNFTSHASDLALNALSMLGIRYKYGGTTPEGGLDCSGLVLHVFKKTWDKELPRTSEEMSHLGQRVEKNELQPGDLVFYNTLRRAFSHVGIYLGDNKFIHSSSSGGDVRIEDMEASYWRKRFNGARRVSVSE